MTICSYTLFLHTPDIAQNIPAEPSRNILTEGSEKITKITMLPFCYGAVM